MMGTQERQNYMKGTTQNIIIKMEGNQRKLPAPVNTSCSEHGAETLCLFGVNSKIIQDNKASTVQYSEMKARINQASLSDRLTPLLISAGLVRGIIPMSMRARSSQLILDIVLRPPDGNNAE